MQPKKYHIITYGCQMNVHESEKLAGMLEARGYITTDLVEDADIVALNTCTIRQNADNKLVGNLGYLKTTKVKNKNLIIAVFGCMPQVDGAAAELAKKFSFINIILGTHNLFKFGDYLDRALNGERVLEIDSESKVVESVEVKRTSGVNAWVNIMYGCDNFCTYCIVPYVRGREKSRESELIVKEVEDLLKAGYKEITLLGQNVNSYKGIDKDGSIVSFAQLLKQIAVLPFKFRLKFMTSHPKDLTQEVIGTIATHDNIAQFFHLPVQAGSDRVLGLMNRKYNSKQYLSLIASIKKAMPNAGFSSDVMVGFPTETEEDFLATLSLVEKARYHNLFMFIYSPRNGTKAAEMDGQIDKKVVDNRFRRLVDLQARIANELALESVGRIYEVLVDSYNDKKGHYSGKTNSGKMVSFKSEKNITGEFVNIKINSAKNSNLFGDII